MRSRGRGPTDIYHLDARAERPVSDPASLFELETLSPVSQPLARSEPPPAARGLARSTDTDARLVELWLHGRSPHTQRAYRADAARFLGFVARPLQLVTLGDVQAFADS